MTALFEDILYGNAERTADPDAIFVWLSDSPMLNEQTKFKIEKDSNKIWTRDLVTIDANFDAELLDGGHIYFLNTQKLGSDKLLTTLSDNRQYSIWTTLSNTARKFPQNFYVVIDEAHRGAAVSQREINKAHSIMQKFIHLQSKQENTINSSMFITYLQQLNSVIVYTPKLPNQW